MEDSHPGVLLKNTLSHTESPVRFECMLHLTIRLSFGFTQIAESSVDIQHSHNLYQKSASVNDSNVLSAHAQDKYAQIVD